MTGLDESAAQDVVTFVGGLPGFETCRRFVLVAAPALDPFTCVHGVDQPAPSFLAIDPRKVVEGYECSIAPADRARLEARPDQPLVWLALVTLGSDRATVNLRAPLVISPVTMRGVQVVAADAHHALDHPLTGF